MRDGGIGAALALALACPVYAASVGSESSIGLASEYSSNPLYSSPATAAESAAFLVNLPITYNGDAQTLDLIPRLRLAATRGNTELLSNYQYLDASWRLSGERTSFGADADWHRDSTLYNVFEDGALQGQTAHRTEDIGGLRWQHTLTERSDVQWTASWDRVSYGAQAQGALTSYDYGQTALQYEHSLGERWQASGSAGYGRYALVDNSYQSQQWFAQLAAKHALSERWSLTLQAGYSYLRDRKVQPELQCDVQFLFCAAGFYPFTVVDVTLRSSRGSPNGGITFEHEYQRAVLDVSISRAIQPSGLGALVTQDDASVTTTFTLSERWSLGVALHGARISDAVQSVQLGSRRYYDFGLSNTWRLTEYWSLQFGAILTQQRIDAVNRSNATASLTLFRQFGRLRLR
jgi:hypothetical protein